jgi:hypothetical protein
LPDGKCDSVFAGPRFLLDFDCDEDQAVCGFDCEFEEGEDEDAPGHVVFHADECGSPERLAHLVQTYLRRFHPDRSWALSWSVTCSKLRVGEFGGGGVLVTAERLCWVNTWEFLEEQADRFEKIGRCEPHGEHPQFPRADWGRAVGEGQTVLGYWGWVVARLTALEPDDSPE